MKKMMTYAGFVLRSNPPGFLLSCILYVGNLLFAAGLFSMASFLLSLSALQPTYDKMMIPVVSVRLFGVGRAVLSYTERYCSHDNTFRILKKLRLKLYDSMMPKLISEKHRRGADLSSLITDIELMQEGILRLVYPLASSLLLLVTGTIIAWLLHPLFVFCYVFLFVLNIYLYPLLMYLLNLKKTSQIDYDSKRLYEELLELREGIVEITADAREEDWISRIETQLETMNGSSVSHLSFLSVSDGIVSLLQGISNLILLILATVLAVHEEIPGVMVAAAVLGLTTMVTEGLLPGQTYFKFRGLKRAVESVFPEEEAVQEPQQNADMELAAYQSLALSVENLTFSHNSSRTVLSNLSLNACPGNPVVIAGPSGAGKSTLFALLLGFELPEAGRICLGDQDLSTLSQKERLKLFSAAEQKPFFFHQTIRENLQLADPLKTEEELLEILEQVQLKELIADLELGLDTPLYEWGSNLSGGELQRLSIARAMLKNTAVYLFDEPTAGLDTINEKKIMKLILTLSESRTVVVISHRIHHLEEFRNICRIA